MLFAPVEPAAAGRALDKSLGFLGRRRARGAEPVAPPAALARQIHRDTDSTVEPAGLVRELASIPFERPSDHPPAIVFAPQNDPLVDREHALSFVSPYARAARTALVGRWWQSSAWDPIADEAHRFLILTLGDRVVEFPEEILES